MFSFFFTKFVCVDTFEISNLVVGISINHNSAVQVFSVCVCVFYSVWCALNLFSFPSVYCIGLLSLYMWQRCICFHSLLSIFFSLSDFPLFILLICPFVLFPLSVLSLFSLSSLNGEFSFPYFIPPLC